jgi:hypothetical protein
MDDQSSNSYTERRNALELEKLEAEVRLLKANTLKAELEASKISVEELKLRRDLKWLAILPISTIIGCVVAFGKFFSEQLVSLFK